MKRKVVRHGPSTFTVSLPKKWVERTNIKVGDEVSIKVQEEGLLISKGNILLESVKEVEISKTSERYITSQITRAYRSGHRQIIIKFKDVALVKLIKSTVGMLIGASIINFEKHKCVVEIQDALIEEENISLLRKMTLSLKMQVESIIGDMCKGVKEDAIAIQEFRFNIWMLREHLLRKCKLSLVGYEEYSQLSHISFCLLLISAKLNSYYKRVYTTKKGKFPAEIFEEVKNALDWVLKKLSNDEKIGPLQEATFRDMLLQKNKALLNSNLKNKSLVALEYYCLEMIDACVSYLVLFKEN